MDELSSDERHQFAFEVAVVARRWRTRLDERLKDLGMSQARWVALHWLGLFPEGLSQTVLAERTAVEAPTLIRVVDQLEQQGLIERRAEPGDRRIKRLCITEAAKPIVEEIGVIAEALRHEAMADIPIEDLRMAMDVLRRVRARLG
jgi:MarR family transcriptional regulator for hemolysin